MGLVVQRSRSRSRLLYRDLHKKGKKWRTYHSFAGRFQYPQRKEKVFFCRKIFCSQSWIGRQRFHYCSGVIWPILGVNRASPRLFFTLYNTGEFVLYLEPQSFFQCPCQVNHPAGYCLFVCLFTLFIFIRTTYRHVILFTVSISGYRSFIAIVMLCKVSGPS